MPAPFRQGAGIVAYGGVMPWHIVENHPDCPTDEGWGVVKDDDGALEGCHATRADAEDQMAALYAQESGSSEQAAASAYPGGMRLAIVSDDGQPVAPSSQPPENGQSFNITSGQVRTSVGMIDLGAGQMHISDPGGYTFRTTDTTGTTVTDRLVLAPTDAPAEPAPPAEPVAAETTEWVLAVEGQPTGDGRIFAEGSLTWRELPMPFMARDTTEMGHDGAVMVGHIVTVARQGAKIVAQVEFIETTDETALNLQQMIRNGDLRWVSVDVDSVEGVIIWNEGEMMDLPAPDAEGNVEMPLMTETLRVDAGRIIGATAVPMQAIDDAQLVADLLAGRMTVTVDWEAVALTAALTDDADMLRGELEGNDAALAALERLISAAGVEDTPPADNTGDTPTEGDVAMTAAVTVPDSPPAAWFDNPKLSGPTEMTVTDDGRVFGHLALWNSCHVGFTDQCVMAPHSPSSYAAFTTGELVTAEGSRVRVGQITTGSGHADLALKAGPTKEHYDHTGWAAADVAVGEDEHGIWLAGAVRPGQDPAQLREFMAAAISGDWRKVNGRLDLVGIASVNVPGFQKLVASIHASHGQIDALVAAPPPECSRRPVWQDSAAQRIAASIGRHPTQLAAARDAVAARIGRDRQSRREALARRVRSI